MIEALIYSIAMFFIGAATDLIFALYVRNLADKNFKHAARWSVGAGICSLLVLEGFLVYPIACISWLVGLYVGTLKSEKLNLLIEKHTKK